MFDALENRIPVSSPLIPTINMQVAPIARRPPQFLFDLSHSLVCIQIRPHCRSSDALQVILVGFGPMAEKRRRIQAKQYVTIVRVAIDKETVELLGSML